MHRLSLLIMVITTLVLGCQRSPQMPSLERRATQPATIEGPSMAPNLLGIHRVIKCSRCDYEFPIDAERTPRDGFACCPNCATGNLKINDSRALAADNVNVRVASLGSLRSKVPPTRWALAAWKHPLEDDAFTIKRVVGFPGERVDISNGDVFIDGQRAKKTFAEQRLVRQHVHTWSPAISGTLSADHPSSRWYGDEDWSSSLDEIIWQPRPLDADYPLNDLVDWLFSSPLTYRHQRGVPSLTNARQWQPVADNDPYNQAISRNLHDVGDLMLGADVNFDSQTRLTFALHDTKGWHVVGIDARSEIVVVYRPLGLSAELEELSVEDAMSLALSGDIPVDAMTKLSLQHGSHSIAVSTFDHQTTVAIDSVEVLRIPCSHEWESLPRQPIAEPVMIQMAQPSRNTSPKSNGPGSKQGNVIKRLTLYRDIHYLPSSENRAENPSSPQELDGWYLLGDNVPVSRDSRHWERTAIQFEDFVGVLLPPATSADRSSAK